MKVCTSCHLCYEDIHTFCATDQSLLVSSLPASPFIAKKYRLDWLVGQGRLGKVFEGTILETDRRVAIKLLLPELAGRAGDLKQFRAEAYAVAHLSTRIDQQHVARTYDYGTLTDGTPYFVTEFVEGQPLNEYLKINGRVGISESIEIARQIAGGLEAAHRASVIHGDLKLSNILVSRDRHGRIEVKILEFGFTRMRSLLAAHNDYWGCPDQSTEDLHYVAPEQRYGRNPNERSDVYSLGVILYELLDGQQIVTGDVPIDQITLSEDLTPLPEIRDDIPEPLWQLVKQALDEKPISRPWSAAVFARQLDKIEHPEFAASATEFEPAVELPSEPENDSTDVADVVVENDVADVVAENVQVAAAAAAAASAPSASEYTVEEIDLPTISQSVETPQPSPVQDQVDEVEPAVVLLNDETPYVEEEGWELEQVDRVLSGADPANYATAPAASSRSFSTALNPISNLLVATKARLQAPTTVRISVVLLCALVASGVGLVIGNRLSSDRFGVSLAKSLTKTERPSGAPAQDQVRTASVALVPPAQHAPQQTAQKAPQTASTNTPAPVAQASPAPSENQAINQPEQAVEQPTDEKGDEEALHAVLDQWLAATNGRDVESQMSLYTDKVDTFYGKRNASLDTVREHKSRVYERASSIDMRAGEPEIKIDESGQKAIVRFRKEWVIKGKNGSRGRATQELTLVKTDAGWRISGERNVG